MTDFGFVYRLTGCLIAAIAIFLPSFLLAISLFPLWETLQQYVFLQRMLVGIKSGIVGIMIVSTFFLTRDMFTAISTLNSTSISSSLITLLLTFALLYSQRISPPLIVLLCGIAGYLF